MKDWKTTLKKLGLFIDLFAVLFGAGSSLGWLGYEGQWLAFVAELGVIGMAVPCWIKHLKMLIA